MVTVTLAASAECVASAACVSAMPVKAGVVLLPGVGAALRLTTGATLTQYYPCMLKSVTSGTGNMLWSAEL